MPETTATTEECIAAEIKGETWEFCLILSGVAEITEDGHPPITYRAGDCFIMKPGYLGTWRTLETVRKVWVAA